MKFPNYSINKINSIFALGIGILLMFYFFSTALIHPNSFMFNFSGDGSKNYYTFAYYIANNNDLTNFEGMNYPYGESFLYTDCHPFLAVLLKTLNYFVDTSDYSIGILNYCLILSLLITGITIFNIFKLLKINFLIALFASIGMVMLNPQIFRFYGHFALSYAFAIPLTILLVLKLNSTEKPKRILFYIFLNNLLFLFIHAYLGLMTSLTVILFYFFKIAAHIFSKSKCKTELIHLFSAGVLPILLFFVFTKLSDKHTGRTNNPYGIELHHADVNSVFLPNSEPLNYFALKIFPQTIQTWEGLSYIGISSILILFISALYLMRSFLIKQRLTSVESRLLFYLFLASFILLLVSFFVPFRWNFEHWLEHLKVIKQFRALGRFTWVFYYVSGIVSIVMLNKYFNYLRTTKLKWTSLVLFIFPIFTIFEGYYQINQLSKSIELTKNMFNKNQLSESFQRDLNQVSVNDFQAILPLPYFNVGSENYAEAPANPEILNLSFIFSYHLKLPMFSSMLTRISLEESKKSMQLLSESFYEKLIKTDIKSKKPILLVCFENNLSEQEKLLIARSKLISKRTEYSLYSLKINDLLDRNTQSEFERFKKMNPKLRLKNNFLVSDTSLYFEAIDFKSDNVDISHHEANGCKKSTVGGTTLIYAVNSDTLQSNKTYTVRIWVHNKGENFGQDKLTGMMFFEKQTKNVKNTEWLPSINASNTNTIDGHWSMVERSFVNDKPDVTYNFLHVGNSNSKKDLHLDHLLFYDNDLIIYDWIIKKNLLYKNNHWIQF